MSEKKEESIYDEARRTVSELNQTDTAYYEAGRFFVYTEWGHGCAITFGEINLWQSDDDDRVFDEDKNEWETLRARVGRKLAELAETFARFAKEVNG